MTWNQLNTLTNNMLPDALGACWYDLVDDGADDEPIWSCGALEMVIETMEEICNDPDCQEDYSHVLPQLRAAR